MWGKGMHGRLGHNPEPEGLQEVRVGRPEGCPHGGVHGRGLAHRARVLLGTAAHSVFMMNCILKHDYTISRSRFCPSAEVLGAYGCGS